MKKTETLATLVKRAATDPGHFAGYRLDRSLGEWIGDAIDAVMRDTPQGRAATGLYYADAFQCTHEVGAAAAYVNSTAEIASDTPGVKPFEVKDVLYQFAIGEIDADAAVAQLTTIRDDALLEAQDKAKPE